MKAPRCRRRGPFHRWPVVCDSRFRSWTCPSPDVSGCGEGSRC